MFKLTQEQIEEGLQKFNAMFDGLVIKNKKTYQAIYNYGCMLQRNMKKTDMNLAEKLDYMESVASVKKQRRYR